MESYREQKRYCERVRANKRAEEYKKYEKLNAYEKCLVDRTMADKRKDFFSMIVNGRYSNTQKCSEHSYLKNRDPGQVSKPKKGSWNDRQLN